MTNAGAKYINPIQYEEAAAELKAILREKAGFGVDILGNLTRPESGRLPVDEGPQTVTRFEVIGNGRELVVNPCRIELSYQDGGRTLKVFVTRLAGKPNGNFTESPKDQP